MSEREVIRFRLQAEEAQQFAEKSIDVLEKDAWLKVACEWTKLAESASANRGK